MTLIPHSRPTVGLPESEAVAQVLSSGNLAQGRWVRRFEEEMGSLLRVPFGVATSSGTAALHLILLALGINDSHEILIPSFTCSALLHAVLMVGARPVICDISLEDNSQEGRQYNVSPEEIRRRISRRTGAILVPHMFGLPAPVGEILEISSPLAVPMVEGGAQALGAWIDSSHAIRGMQTSGRRRRTERKPAGSFGTASFFSFYATKVMTTGEGGMVATSSPQLGEKVGELREYDQKEEFSPSFNYKMSEIQGAMGVVQKRRLKEFLSKREEIAAIYDRAFSNTELILPQKSKGRIYYRYVVRFPSQGKRDLAQKRLREGGVESKPPVFLPLHRLLGRRDSREYPYTEEAFFTALSLPIYPSLMKSEVKKICGIVLSSLEG